MLGRLLLDFLLQMLGRFLLQMLGRFLRRIGQNFEVGEVGNFPDFLPLEGEAGLEFNLHLGLELDAVIGQPAIGGQLQLGVKDLAVVGPVGRGGAVVFLGRLLGVFRPKNRPEIAGFFRGLFRKNLSDLCLRHRD